MMRTVTVTTNKSKSHGGNAAASKYRAASPGAGYRKYVKLSAAQRYVPITRNMVKTMTPATFHDPTALSRYRLKMACSDVTQAKNRSEEHTSELQSLRHLVCRLLLEKK